MRKLRIAKQGLGLSRCLGDRVLVALMCLVVGTPAGIGTWMILRNALTFPKPPIESWATFAFGLFLDEMVQAIFVLCLMGLTWAVATPDWVRGGLERHAMRTLWMVLLALGASLFAIVLIR